MNNKRTKRGVTFVSVLIALFVLAVGITALLKAYPVISRLSDRAKNHVAVSLIADKIFTVIENVYGDAGGPPVPVFLSGTDEEFSRYFYSAEITEEKERLYAVEVKVSWEREGKVESEHFFAKFRRK